MQKVIREVELLQNNALLASKYYHGELCNNQDEVDRRENDIDDKMARARFHAYEDVMVLLRKATRERSEKLEAIVREMMQNYPEAGSCCALQCRGWLYEKMEFEFHDEETDQSHEVTLPRLIDGMEVLLKIIEDGKYYGSNGCQPNLLAKGYNWDACDCDALVQCAILGKVSYG